MTTFAVGDRVSSSIHPRWKTGTVKRVLEGGAVVVQPDGYNYPPGCASDFPGAGTHAAKHFTLIPPTFAKGDKVVAVTDVSALGVRKGVVYTVQTVQSYGADYGTLVCVESASGHRTWSDPSRFKQYEPKPQVFELRYGDKVKNTRTGREGQVWTGPISNILKVYDVRPPYRDGVPAAALEEYEDHHPGTYEIVSRREGSEEPY